jgi:hypothetical protein
MPLNQLVEGFANYESVEVIIILLQGCTFSNYTSISLDQRFSLGKCYVVLSTSILLPRCQLIVKVKSKAYYGHYAQMLNDSLHSPFCP